MIYEKQLLLIVGTGYTAIGEGKVLSRCSTSLLFER